MKKIFLLLIVYNFTCNNLFAQWTSNTAANTPICVLPGKQADPRILDTKDGGAYIAWKDWRNGTTNPDIYLQKINAKGEIKWIVNGISLCSDIKDQSTPNLVEDAKGGVIVAWSDWRSTVERDLYAQRVDSNGAIKWLLNGAPVTTKTNREHNEKIVVDGLGGAFIFWEQQGSGLWDIWAQHIDSAGNRLWGIGGKAMSTITSNKINPKVQGDKKGGAIVVWQDERNNANFDVYAQRVDGAGNLKWGTSGKLLCGGIGDQIDPKIDPDSSSGGVYVSWIDSRNAIDYDIYAQRIDSNGNLLWNTAGMPVVATDSNQSAQDMLSNSSMNGVIITWKDKRNTSTRFDIYAQKLNSNGTPQWGTNGIKINTGTKDQLNPNICEDGKSGAIIVFQDNMDTFDNNIIAQRIDANGNLLWNPTGVIISNAIKNQKGPKHCVDGKGGAIVVWEDDRLVGDRNIYIQHIHAAGNVWPLPITNYVNNETVLCSPNPSTGLFTIQCKQAITNMQIVNAKGQNINATIDYSNANNIKINMQQAANGVYIVQYMLQNEKYTQIVNKL